MYSLTLDHDFKGNGVFDEEGIFIVETVLEVNGFAIFGDEDRFDIRELGLRALAGLISVEHYLNFLGVSDELNELHKVLSFADNEGVNDKWVLLVDLKKKLEDFDLLFLLNDIGGKIDITLWLWSDFFWSW